MLIRKTYKKIFFKILDILNMDKRYIKSIYDNEKLVILNLHRVSNDENPFYPSLSPQLFEELLKFVTKEFNVITFREIEEYKNSKKPSLILSFDDGFHDFLKYAMPILDKYNVRVNLNVIPQCIESGKPVWDVMLGDYLNQAPVELVNKIELPNFEIKLNKSNKSQFGLALTHYLKERSKKEREDLWKNIEKNIQAIDVQFTKMLNKDEVLEVSKTHEIGVHSYTHESMSLESREFFEKDFLKCKEYFSNILHLPFDIYAFPSGSYQDYQLEFLEKEGLSYILLVEEKYSNYKSKIYHRFTYYGNSSSEIKIRALGWQR